VRGRAGYCTNRAYFNLIAQRYTRLGLQPPRRQHLRARGPKSPERIHRLVEQKGTEGAERRHQRLCATQRPGALTRQSEQSFVVQGKRHAPLSCLGRLRSRADGTGRDKAARFGAGIGRVAQSHHAPTHGNRPLWILTS
jgi:SOS-response transcriptional repressor LexA